jgi:hypothetical protein
MNTKRGREVMRDAIDHGWRRATATAFLVCTWVVSPTI